MSSKKIEKKSIYSKKKFYLQIRLDQNLIKLMKLSFSLILISSKKVFKAFHFLIQIKRKMLFFIKNFFL